MSSICDSRVREECPGEFQCSEHLMYRVIRYLLLPNKLPPNLGNSHNKHLWSPSFYGSGIWMWLSWVLWSEVPHRLNQGVTGCLCHLSVHLSVWLEEDPLLRRLTWLLTASDPCWLLARVSSSFTWTSPCGSCHPLERAREEMQHGSYSLFKT